MKKLSVLLSTILAVAIVAISFTSCEEPEAGVYKPKKKVAKVYEQEVGEAEYLTQEWKWNGNQLASVSFYDEGEFKGMDEYIYEGDRVVKVRDNYGYYAEYDYNDKQFEKIEYYSPTNTLLAEVVFQYDGKRIFKITLQANDDFKNITDMMNRGYVGQLLSKEGMKMVAEKVDNHSKETVVINLSYDGDNLTSIVVEDESLTFSNYDTHSNILYNFLPFSAYNEEVEYLMLSKNNPGKAVFTVGSFNITTTYIYTYDGDFPATIQSNTVFEDESYASTTRIVYN